MKPVIFAAGLMMLSTMTLLPAVSEGASAPEEPSVLVDVSKVADRLAGELGVDVGRIPPGVDMQIEAAAEVCAATPDMLAYAGAGGQQIGCEATEISTDLIQALREQLELRQDSTGAGQQPD